MWELIQGADVKYQLVTCSAEPRKPWLSSANKNGSAWCDGWRFGLTIFNVVCKFIQLDSITSTNKLASHGAGLSDLSLRSKHSVQHSSARSGDNRGAALTAQEWCIHSFPIEFANLARPMESPLCRMYFLFLHAQWLKPHCSLIIYSKWRT